MIDSVISVTTIALPNSIIDSLLIQLLCFKFLLHIAKIWSGFLDEGAKSIIGETSKSNRGLYDKFL